LSLSSEYSAREGDVKQMNTKNLSANSIQPLIDFAGNPKRTKSLRKPSHLIPIKNGIFFEKIRSNEKSGVGGW